MRPTIDPLYACIEMEIDYLFYVCKTISPPNQQKRVPSPQNKITNIYVDVCYYGNGKGPFARFGTIAIAIAKTQPVLIFQMAIIVSIFGIKGGRPRPQNPMIIIKPFDPTLVIRGCEV